jgi:uroporphyrinogen decarboxylase
MPVDCPPVWFMRQAGRYMPEYRAMRERYSLLELCAEPSLACEVTLQPLRAFEVDAAILFADILLPLIPLGLELRFAAGEGPVIDNPIRSHRALDALSHVDVSADLGHVFEAVRMIRGELDDDVALIGFAGAPFTVATYAIEGGSSRHFLQTKQMMYRAPDLWAGIMERLTEITVAYLRAQVEAGAQAIQLFDTWAGILAPQDYRQYAQPYSKRVFAGLDDLEVPLIHFGVGTSHLLEDIRDAGGDVIGLDWRIPLDEGWQRIGYDHGVQGNLDPTALFAPVEELTRRVADILRRAENRSGHIFNLGHGILPTTPVDAVKRVVELVHAASARSSVRT